MQYTVQELADKFKIAANKFIEDKKLDDQQKKLSENARYDKAFKEMLKYKPIFIDVKTIANSLYDYLHVTHNRLEYCRKELYQASYKTGFLSIGRNYFIYNCIAINRNRYDGDFQSILISYDDGSINRARLNDNGGTKEDYANIVNPEYVQLIDDPKKFVEECQKKDNGFYAKHCFAKLAYFSEALEQIPKRIDALFKFAYAFADTVDGNNVMEEYLAKYRKFSMAEYLAKYRK
jgi:hypothetical protein